MEVATSGKEEDLRVRPQVKEREDPLVKAKEDLQVSALVKAKGEEELAVAVSAQSERLPSRMRMALLQLQPLLCKAMFALHLL